MSNNLPLMQKIAWQGNATIAKRLFAPLRKSAKIIPFQPSLQIEKQELPPKNYCDQDLDVIYNGDDRFRDTWWNF
jgi:hypothetical protein